MASAIPPQLKQKVELTVKSTLTPTCVEIVYMDLNLPSKFVVESAEWLYGEDLVSLRFVGNEILPDNYHYVGQGVWIEDTEIPA